MISGMGMLIVGILLNRRANQGDPLPGEVFGAPLDDVVVIAVLVVASVLMGASIVLNIAGLSARRRKS